MEHIQAADTAFVLLSSALVLLMTPGLAIFYAGMVRGKNVLGTLLQSFILISLITLEWVYLGYSLSFGPDIAGLTGSLAWVGLRGVSSAPNPDYAATIPHNVFMLFQCMFAVITPALITGTFAERIRFGPFLLFSLLWAVLVYNPVCHWVWGAGGWLKNMGVLDFAGGLVVHLSCGAAALAAAAGAVAQQAAGRPPPRLQAPVSWIPAVRPMLRMLRMLPMRPVPHRPWGMPTQQSTPAQPIRARAAAVQPG